MRNHRVLVFTWCFGLGVLLMNAQSTALNPGSQTGLITVSGAPTSHRSANGTFLSLENYAKQPLSFEQHGESNFVARGQGYAIDIRGAQATIALLGTGSLHTVGMEFVHARQATATPQKELPGKVNYIFGNDPRRWRLGLPTYEQVTYWSLYPGIDAVYYGNQNQLEFEAL
jgi:hypothetical protein